VCSLELQQLIEPASDDILYALGYSGASQLHAYGINIKTGALIKHDAVELPNGFCEELSLLSSEMLVTLDASRTILVTLGLKDGKISFEEEHIRTLVPGFSGKATLLSSKLDGMFAMKYSSYVVFFRVNDKGKLQVVDKIDNAAVVSDMISFAEEQQAFGIVQHQGSKIQFMVKLGHDYSNDLLKESIQMDHQRGLVQKVFINNYIRTDRSPGFRALVVMEDHSLLLLQQGDIVWSREDGLASVVDVTTSELPVEKKGVSVAKVEEGFLEWLKVWILMYMSVCMCCLILALCWMTILIRISYHGSIIGDFVVSVTPFFWGWGGGCPLQVVYLALDSDPSTVT